MRPGQIVFIIFLTNEAVLCAADVDGVHPCCWRMLEDWGVISPLFISLFILLPDSLHMCPDDAETYLAAQRFEFFFQVYRTPIQLIYLFLLCNFNVLCCYTAGFQSMIQYSSNNRSLFFRREWHPGLVSSFFDFRFLAKMRVQRFIWQRGSAFRSAPCTFIIHSSQTSSFEPANLYLYFSCAASHCWNMIFCRFSPAPLEFFWCSSFQ